MEFTKTLAELKTGVMSQEEYDRLAKIMVDASVKSYKNLSFIKDFYTEKLMINKVKIITDANTLEKNDFDFMIRVTNEFVIEQEKLREAAAKVVKDVDLFNQGSVLIKEVVPLENFPGSVMDTLYSFDISRMNDKGELSLTLSFVPEEYWDDFQKMNNDINAIHNKMMESIVNSDFPGVAKELEDLNNTYGLKAEQPDPTLYPTVINQLGYKSIVTL